MKKKLAAVVLSMVLCLGASVTTLAAGSPSANNSNTTTSQTTTAATEVKVEQKAITQDALNDVQKEKLSGYFTDMAAIDNDTCKLVISKPHPAFVAKPPLPILQPRSPHWGPTRNS